MLLTGGTGFIGIHLLAGLLRAFPKAHVCCLVRGRDRAHCLERLHAAAGSHGFDEEIGDGWRRVEAFPGDVTRQKLGLSDADYATLLLRVESVLHFAARDNFFLPFLALYSSHVGSLLELINFCARGTVKSLLHCSSCKVRLIDKFNGLPDDGMYNGYAQTKFVAHRLIEEMPNLGRGMQCLPPVRLLNMGYVYPDYQPPPVPDISDAFEVVFKVMLAEGVAPALDSPIDFAPVSYVTSCILEILEDDQSRRWGEPGIEGPLCHEIFAPHSLRFADVKEAIRELKGAEGLREVPMIEFVAVWNRVLMAVGSARARFMQPLLTENFSLQLNTTFEEKRQLLYSSARHGAPPRMGRAELLELLRTIDERMRLQ